MDILNAGRFVILFPAVTLTGNEKNAKSGGHGGRTRVLTDDKSLISNDLRQRIERLAALWLQSPVGDEHDLTRIVAIAEQWNTLSAFQKVKTESAVYLANET